MKTSLKLWASALTVALFTNLCGAAATANAPPVNTNGWWTHVSFTPYGAMKHPDFGSPFWGGGLDLGYQCNPTLSLHLANSFFEQSSFVDETEVIARANLWWAYDMSGRERLVGFALGSATRDWNEHDWAFGVGLGVEYKLNNHFSLGMDSRIRAFFNNEEDLMTRGFLSLRW